VTNNTEAPKQSNYDIVIVGGAIMGSSTAWFLTENKDFDGRVLVVERDTSYSACSTAHTYRSERTYLAIRGRLR